MLPINESDALLRPSATVTAAEKRVNQLWAVVGILSVLLVVILVTIMVVQISAPDHTTEDYNAWHDAFLGNVNRSTISEYMQWYSSAAHIAGSAQDNLTAAHTAALFTSFGLETRVETLPVMLTLPLFRSVQVLGASPYNCTLDEPPVPQDPTSNSTTAVPTWNAWSASGVATGPLVYINYGTAADFAALDAMNVSLNGCVAIARYGMNFRGDKVSGAVARGAVAVLLYSDPADVGFQRGPTYPVGPWANNNTVQRGEVANFYGDPSTPGWPSSAEGPRLTLQQLYDPAEPALLWGPLPAVPVQPLSAADAAPMLLQLAGNRLPSAAWAGGFGLQQLGPGPVAVRVEVQANYSVTNIWNVVGVLPGAEEPDRVVMVGCHRDAWTMGAGDPLSGHSVLLETARGFGSLYRQGWRPRRTVMFVSWDAEEFGLVGSVEFVETHYKQIYGQSLVYLNYDIPVQGGALQLQASASPSLRTLYAQVLRAIPLNRTASLADVWDGTLQPVGSGSDHAGFLIHAGVPVTMNEFSSASSPYGAVYHSNYDSFYWYSQWGDPQFSTHALAAQLWGLMAMRFADDLVLPFNISDYATALVGFIENAQSTAISLGQPVSEAQFSGLFAAAARLVNASSAVMAEVSAAAALPEGQLRALNDRLAFFERCFIADERVSGDPWALHVVFAPAANNSYAGAALPALYNALDSRSLAETQFVINRLVQIFDAASDFVLARFWRGSQ